MKSLGIIVVSLLLFGNGIAQTVTYVPMNSTVTMWLMNAGYSNLGTPVEIQERVILSGDTLINGITYKRVFRGPLDPNATMTFVNAFREDTVTHTRFIWQNSVEDTVDIPFDFSIGDTLHNVDDFRALFRLNGSADYLNPANFLIVIVKDSILEANGAYSGTFNFALNNIDGEYFIYNTHQGLIEFSGHEHWLETYCYRENGEQTPQNEQTPWSYSCDLSLTSESRHAIEVFPNPGNGTFQIQSTLSIAEIRIITMDGRVGTMKYPHSETIELSLNEQGVYWLEMVFSDGNRERVKVINQ